MRSNSSDSEDDILLPSSIHDDFSDGEEGAGEELFHTVSSDEEGETKQQVRKGEDYFRICFDIVAVVTY
jgi:hypothetical protein